MLTTFPALRRVSLISLASFLWEKNRLEQIVWPRPPRDEPVTLTPHRSISHRLMADHMADIGRTSIRTTEYQTSRL